MSASRPTSNDAHGTPDRRPGMHVACGAALSLTVTLTHFRNATRICEYAKSVVEGAQALKKMSL